jgi:Fumarylacetoacetate (FAA) hydrolase family
LRFINYQMGGRQGIAVDDGDRFRGLTCDKARYPGDLSTLIISSEDLSEVGRRLLEEPVIDVRAVTLLPPVARPPKILCVGLNYEDHLSEVGLKRPEYPEIFARFATGLIGHGAEIARPPESNKLDYEAELAVVIGLGGRRIAKDAAAARELIGMANFVASASLPRRSSAFGDLTAARPESTGLAPHTRWLTCIALEDAGEVCLGLKSDRARDIHQRHTGAVEHLLRALDSAAQQIFVRPQTRGCPKLRCEMHTCEAGRRSHVREAYSFVEPSLNKVDCSF